MPFAGFEDFDACLKAMEEKGHDKESAERICGALKAKYEGGGDGEHSEGVLLPLSFVELVCPPCAQRMKALGWKAIRASIVTFQGMTPAALAGLCEKFGDAEGFRTRCMESSLVAEVDDPGAFCNWLKQQCLSELAEKREMSELAGWLEVFRAGDYGEKGSYTAEMLAQIAGDYHPALHEAPVVVGHPEHDKPAYAWVDGLRVRRNGAAVLEAHLAQVDPEFEQLVKAGRFKQRSIALYTQFPQTGRPYLRHLGFLGAQPPEVKGLRPIPFKSGDTEYIEFAVNIEGKMSDEKNEQVSTEDVGLVKKFLTALRAVFTEPTPKPAEDAATAFAEQKAQLEAQMKALAEKQAAFAEAERNASLDRWWSERLSKGKLLPAFEGTYGLQSLLKQLAGTTITLTFKETKDGKEVEQKRTAVEALQAFLEALPQMVRLDQVVKPSAKTKRRVKFTEPVRGAMIIAESVELAERAQALAEEKKISYAEALRLAQAEREA